ncbi:MAG: hypothetical protein WCI27_04925 [Candidatus Omnitrophota bacterium]
MTKEKSISRSSLDVMKKCRKVWLINPKSKVHEQPRPARVNTKRVAVP